MKDYKSLKDKQFYILVNGNKYKVVNLFLKEYIDKGIRKEELQLLQIIPNKSVSDEFSKRDSTCVIEFADKERNLNVKATCCYGGTSWSDPMKRRIYCPIIEKNLVPFENIK